MRTSLALLLLVVGLGAYAPGADAQAVAIVGGNVQVNVPYVGAGFGTGTNASTTLRWRGAYFTTTNKITVQSTVSSQQYGLSVRAVPTNYGQSAGTVALTNGMSAQNLVVNIPPTFLYIFGITGDAPLQYSATATASAPAGQDQHTIVYTITPQ